MANYSLLELHLDQWNERHVTQYDALGLAEVTGW